MLGNSTVSKVGRDLYVQQFIWSLWFLGILFVIHLAMVIAATYFGTQTEDFLQFSNSASTVYMVVIGIIAVYAFLTFYVNQGVTRKHYFAGTVIAAIGVTFSIAVIVMVITGMEHLILQWLNHPQVLQSTVEGSYIETGENSITVNITGFMFGGSQLIVYGTNWFLSLIMLTMNMLAYYIIGLFLGAGYYRYGWVVGFAFVLAAILIVLLLDFLWGSRLGDLIVIGLLPENMDMPVWASVVGTTIVMVIILWLIRQLTKKVSIKM